MTDGDGSSTHQTRPEAGVLHWGERLSTLTKVDARTPSLRAHLGAGDGRGCVPHENVLRQSWIETVAVPLLVSDGEGTVLNALAERCLVGPQTVLKADGQVVNVDRLAALAGPTVVDVFAPQATVRTFRIERRVDGDCTVSTLIEETGVLEAERQQADAEIMLKWVTEMSGVGPWEVDLATNQPMWSDQVKRIHEVPDDYVPDLAQAINFYAPEARDEVASAVEVAMKTGQDWDLELPLITAKGRRIWVRAKGHADFKGGECRRLRGTFQDVTIRRAIQEGLQSAVQRARDFERVFETAPTYQCVADFNGYFLTLNSGWSDLLGYSIEELMSQRFIEFVHPEDREATWQQATDMVKAGASVTGLENRYVAKDGTYRWLRWYITTDVHDRKIYAVAADVTAEKERSIEIQRLAWVADRTENAVVVTDARGLIIWVNPSFTRMTGFSAEDMLGHSPGSRLQGDETDSETVAKIRRALSNHEGIRVEMLNYRKDGTRFWVDIDIQPVVDERGVLINFVSVGSDVTAQKEYEAQLRRARDAAESTAQAAARANEAKTRFLANMSHEIRTPLNGVLGMTELLESTRLDGEQRECVRTIGRSGQALLTLVNDILDFSKIEANKLELDRAPYAMDNVVDWVLDLVRVSAEKKNVELQAYVPSDLPTILGDEGRIRQVLLNLVSNAIKFTQDGFVRIEVGAQRSGDELALTISVSDTGIGMSEEVLQRLFQPFTQADASTTRKFGGTGLGLSICLSLMRLMNGNIRAESSEGIGSRFWVTVSQPVVEQAVAGAATRDLRTPHDFSGRSVLLVEDNAINQRVASRMLERLGCAVAIANDGVEALERLNDRGFDVVLMDCQMPRMDGFEATRKIRSLDPPAREVPIIALTASALKGDEEKCLAAGMTDFLSKPIRGKELARMLGGYMPAAD